MRTTFGILCMGVLMQLLAAPAVAQELPPRIGGNPVVLSAEDALREGAPLSATDHAFRLSRIELSLDQDGNGQWRPEQSDDWRFRGTGGEVLIELFPGEILWMRGTGIEDAEEASSWIGEVLLPEPGVAIITRSKEGVYGTFDVGNRRYALASGTGQGRQGFVKQVDSRDIGICLTGSVHGDHAHHKHYHHPAQVPTWASKAVAQKSGGGSSTVDILFLYTSGALSYMGGDPSAFINNLVASLNAAFSASEVTGSVRAVYYGIQTGVDSPDDMDDFFNLRNKMQAGTSPFSSLASLRNAHAADIMVLLVDRALTSGPNWPYWPICGVAGNTGGTPLYQPHISGGSSDDLAYAVVAVNCADNDRTFHHEVGHLIGGWHDEIFDEWQIHGVQAHTCGIGNGSCGYTDMVNEFRTIMGSNQGSGFVCDVFGCPRLLRFSDWDQTAWVNGGWRALGQVQGSRNGHENFVATMNGEEGRTATIPWVADYRTPGGSAPSAPTQLHVETCYSQHIISWSGAAGTIGWHEVEVSPNASYIPATNIYRGEGSVYLFHTSTTPIRTRVRACNAVGCSAWKNSLGSSNPYTCI